MGLGIIAVELIGLFWWLVPNDGTRFTAGMLAYGVLVAVALSMWHGKHAEKFSDARDWGAVLLASILVGALFFGVDVIVGGLDHPGISPIEAGTKAGSPFGFILTIFICPGVTMVAVAGLVRSFLIRERGDSA